VVSLLKDHFNTTWKIWINRIAGMIIFSFGVIVLVAK
jgi:hypothetical protein